MIKLMKECLTGRYRKFAVLGPICVILEVFFDIFIPLVMAKIIDVGINDIENGGLGYIINMGLFMILLAGLSMLCGALSSKCSGIASAGFARGLRDKMFDKIQQYSFSNIDKFSTASLVTRITTDINNIRIAFMMSLRLLFRAPIMLISTTLMAVSINQELAWVFLIAVPILGAALYLIASTAYPKFLAMLKKYDKLNLDIQENLTGIRVVKSFVRGNYEKKKFQGTAEEVRAAQMGAQRILAFNDPMFELVMYACMIAISWFGGNLIIAGSMTTGEFMSYISYIRQILMALMLLTNVLVQIVISQASVSRIREVLDEEIDIKDSTKFPDLKVADGSIEFDDVCFSYSNNKDNLTLSHISLSIQPGEMVGIIGGTGSAKTTLVQLIPRLYDVMSGHVRVGGRDVRDYSLKNLRSSVAMVLQKNVLFSGTIRDNLRWGNPNATDEQIIEACKVASAHDFIMSFPDGYDTDLGQGGVNVSGGQKQRLCIARALLCNPKVIIMDDSTSAVDTATDSQIRSALRQKLSGTTTIMIAQRITSVSEADKIIVMEEGEIVDIGTHDELLERNAIYQDLYHSQQKGVA